MSYIILGTYPNQLNTLENYISKYYLRSLSYLHPQKLEQSVDVWKKFASHKRIDVSSGVVFKSDRNVPVDEPIHQVKHFNMPIHMLVYTISFMKLTLKLDKPLWHFFDLDKQCYCCFEQETWAAWYLTFHFLKWNNISWNKTFHFYTY